MVIAGRTCKIRKRTLPSGTNLSRAHLSACLLLLPPLTATATVLTAGASISPISPPPASSSISILSPLRITRAHTLTHCSYMLLIEQGNKISALLCRTQFLPQSQNKMRLNKALKNPTKTMTTPRRRLKSEDDSCSNGTETKKQRRTWLSRIYSRGC